MSVGILSNRICLITGSSRGIGLGVARVFAENGASVVLHGKDEKLLPRSLATLSEPKQHSYITADLRTPVRDYWRRRFFGCTKSLMCLSIVQEFLAPL